MIQSLQARVMKNVLRTVVDMVSPKDRSLGAILRGRTADGLRLAVVVLGLVSLRAGAATSTTESSAFILDLTGTPLLSSFTKTGTEDTPIAFAIGDFTASYIDPESGGLASIRIESLPTGGVLKLSGSPVSAGQVVPRVNISLLVYEPAANINGTRTFTVTASDGGLSSAPATVTLNIAAVADAPTLTTISTFSGAAEDAGFSLSYATLLAASNAADTDGDAISFRIEAVSSGTLLKGSSGVLPGTTLVSAGETLVWTPVANAFGTLNAFTVKAWDGSSASTTAVQVKVEVAPTNDAPTLASVSPLTGASEDTPSRSAMRRWRPLRRRATWMAIRSPSALRQSTRVR